MEALARKHWTKWRPKKVARHEADGKLDEDIQGAAIGANREIEDLTQQGYQRHEAEEVSLPIFILFSSVPEANEQPSRHDCPIGATNSEVGGEGDCRSTTPIVWIIVSIQPRRLS